MEEITPRTLTALTFLVLVLAPAVTLMLSMLLLALYHRTVRGQMQAAGDESSFVEIPVALPAGEPAPHSFAPDLDRGPRRVALRYAIAGAVLAATFATAAPFVYPHRLGLPGYLVGFWIYLWPAPIALALVLPAGWRTRLALFGGYFAMFALLIAWAGTVKDLPALNSAGIRLPARSSATPQLTLRLWFAVSGAPTLLVLLCFNRWVRAVAPLVLAFVTTVLIGLWVVLLAIFTEAGVEAFVSFAVATGIHVYWLLLAAMLIALLPIAALAWVPARWLARAHQRHTATDQSLMLDSLFLIFASFFGMWLLLGGIAWFLVAPLAFMAYKTTLWLLQRYPPQQSPHAPGLTFLRVFSLGRRSERLLDHLARYWRYLGSVQLITGPDTARSTIKPQQFLDFITGKLAGHFVRDAATLERRLATCNRSRGPDGLYSVNNFFCHRNTWQQALPRLAGSDDRVLMDLRSFSDRNQGCIHELEYLVARVPLQRFLLLIDGTTDIDFLQRVLARAWERAPADAVNLSGSPDDVRLHRYEPGAANARHLVRELFA